MDQLFENVIPYFCSNRPVLDLIEMVTQFDENLTFFSTFICRRLNTFCLALSNQFEEGLQCLKDDTAVLGWTVKKHSEQNNFIQVIADSHSELEIHNQEIDQVHNEDQNANVAEQDWVAFVSQPY